ncbi:23S rRNA (guanosine(2251)-2'-O)-methyltransferase RlmB [Candidatus Erwinia haradaeae]|uniref:23S rRNA (Guanosine-2'-O-)-methyltransferase RlmB n=1 Tax=Candidatus Erwinia haradaeae TaxID=1922217 RepID=A0A803FSZ3_9GAMM|nr:23S rRNA (guanosine(2251)-2'-O)-methyltransferase RlmB [Candidatus Erwinia haradaeae]VFP87347.1 23S rRNA (guanosine-2'-O-)-methyltransferase RlmB [Candidatus Erwinia haradaeae]
MSPIVFGIHAINALIEIKPKHIEKVLISLTREDHRVKTLIKKLQYHNIIIIKVHKYQLDAQSGGGVHQGIIAYTRTESLYKENDLLDLIKNLDNPFFLILDGVTDPHNLGACIRSANASGIHAVITAKDRTAPLNAIAKKSASGATEYIPLIRVTNLVRIIRVLKEENIWIIGATEKANKTLYQTKMTGRLSLVVGGEEKGMRRLTLEHCNELVSIPMIGKVSSLNLSVATGICLYEAVRQRILQNTCKHQK